MTVVPYESNHSRAWTTLLPVAAELAQQIASTDFVPSSLRGNPPAIAAAILYGDEIGVGPMQSLAKIAIINGRPTMAAEMQRALILQAGHDLWIEESTESRCTVAGRRKGSEATSRVTWTADDARRAGLVGKPPWKMYPRQMLLARASAELARAVFPDAIGGLAATEELDGETTPGMAVESPPPLTAPPTTPARRRRANVNAGAATPAPPPAPATSSPPPLPPEEQAVIDALEKLALGDLDEPEELAPELATEKQRTKLGVLVGKLRDKEHVIETIHLWNAVAASRQYPPDQMIELLEGRDADGVLHFGPLLKTLTQPEASSLIDRLGQITAPPEEAE